MWSIMTLALMLNTDTLISHIIHKTPLWRNLRVLILIVPPIIGIGRHPLLLRNEYIRYGCIGYSCNIGTTLLIMQVPLPWSWCLQCGNSIHLQTWPNKIWATDYVPLKPTYLVTHCLCNSVRNPAKSERNKHTTYLWKLITVMSIITCMIVDVTSHNCWKCDLT